MQAINFDVESLDFSNFGDDTMDDMAVDANAFINSTNYISSDEEVSNIFIF